MKCFVAGPMCGINRTSSEPPSHVECGQWSARNCPFLNNPNMVRREDEVMNNQNLRDNAAGLAITRNPGISMLWITKSYDAFKVDNGVLITMGEPERVEWYRCGKPATRLEVMESVDSGFPAMEAIAKTEKGGLKALMAARDRFLKFLPAEAA